MFKRNHTVSGFFCAFVSIFLINVCFGDVQGDLLEAEGFREAGRFEQAETIYNSIISADANSVEAFASQEGLSVIYVAMGKQTEADTAYHELLAKYSNRSGIANAVDHVADAYREIENFQKARACNQYIVDHWPDADRAADAQAGVVRASILMGDEIGAQAAMNKLLSSFSDSTHIAKAVDDVADDYDKAGQYEKARQWHQYVVDHWPEDERALEAQKGVVISNIALGNQTAAQAGVDKLISDFKINAEEIAEAIDNVAEDYCHNKMGNYTKAMELYQYIATSWPTSESAVKTQSDMIRCSILLGDDAGAQVTYDGMLTAFSNHPRLPESMYFVAEEYIKRGVELENSTDLAGAQEHYRKGLVILEEILNDFPPTSYTPEVCSWAGTAYFQLEDYSNSLKYFQRLAEQYPNFENAWQAQFMVGRSYEGMVSSGLLPAAEAMPLIKAAFEKFVTKYPTYPSVGYAQNWLNSYNSR